MANVRVGKVRVDGTMLIPPLIPSLDPFLELREMFRIRHEVNRRLRFPDGLQPANLFRHLVSVHPRLVHLGHPSITTFAGDSSNNHQQWGSKVEA
jgi:hypothetical protein